MHLRVSVTFHGDTIHGARSSGRRQEWPPSPWRLYCALLAGSKIASRGRKEEWGDHRAAAFRWLEQRPPPVVVAPRAMNGRSYTIYGFSNDGDVAARKQARGYKVRTVDMPEGRKVEKRICPTHMLGSPTVHYIWPMGEADVEPATRMAEEAEHLLALGRGIDHAYAVGKVEANGNLDLPGVRWWPCVDPPGSRWWPKGGPHDSLRVPQPGALDDLEEIYMRAAHRLEGGVLDPRDQPRTFRSIVYSPDFASLGRPYAAFWLRPPLGDLHQDDGFCRWHPHEATGLAAAVRDLVAKAAAEDGRSDQWIREYITGHVEKGETNRLSYLSLPTTGETYADGGIRRVMVAEPWGSRGDTVEWIRERLAGREIIGDNGGYGGRLVPIIEGDSDEFDGILGIYKKASRIWSTVTPVVLPGRGRTEKLVQRAFAHAGLPYPARWRVLGGCAWRGDFGVPYKLPPYLQGLPQVHLEIEFEQPLTGPIALGSGRHCGIGILAGYDDVPLPI